MSQRDRDGMVAGTIQSFDPVRFDAFRRLLARPDPEGMRRSHVSRFPGDPERRGTRLPGIVMAWMQRRHLGVDIEESAAPARLARPRTRSLAHPVNQALRLLQPSGTG
jgi:hypothetical protein